MAEPVVPEFLRQSMVDRVSKAIVQHLAENGRSVSWAELPPIWHEIYRDQARAVIASMREPNRDMYEAVLRTDGVDGGTVRENLRVMYQSAIDAALAPPAPSQTDGDA